MHKGLLKTDGGAGVKAMLFAAGAVVLAGGVYFWTAERGAQAAGLLPYQDPAAVEEGRKVYAEYCASCHGASLEGEPDWRQRDAGGYLPAPPHDETGHTWHHADSQLLAITKFGVEALAGAGYRSRMGGYEELLSDAQMLAALAYIKSRWPADIIRRHNEINAQAQP
ncbi:c-type cytochrome [Cribrihabitans pelagius]|uniref:c-type cytochrome n=1 Tax=Cribrihabitans pelagius TaxID=1765746 RepID=UPI003B592A39